MLGIWDHSADSIVLFWGLRASLVDGCLLSLRGFPSVSLYPNVFGKGTTHIGLGPASVTSCYLIYILQGPFSKCNYILSYRGLRLQHRNSSAHNSGQRENETQLKERNLGSKTKSVFARWGWHWVCANRAEKFPEVTVNNVQTRSE